MVEWGDTTEIRTISVAYRACDAEQLLTEVQTAIPDVISMDTSKEGILIRVPQNSSATEADLEAVVAAHVPAG